MLLGDIPIFAMLKQRMHWLSERQSVLAENVANSDTPDYAARDLKELDFKSLLLAAPTRIGAAVTHQAHIQKTSSAPVHGPGVTEMPGFETTPTGNSVVLEEQMIKAAETQMDYEMATGLYTKSLGLLKMALGNR